jgi:hypothetical protein
MESDFEPAIVFHTEHSVPVKRQREKCSASWSLARVLLRYLTASKASRKLSRKEVRSVMADHSIVASVRVMTCAPETWMKQIKLFQKV